ncbi:TetR/AcrR family transcriptional regulator [Antribacter gilvus]|uniref:TetR/AcrR family transcriptional regulator n=1 Tax=Antribacter gilvus TaxID=2304675 RepID=UPI000F787B0F|nr:TetR/AcrR family transcriptional regulator [Antribacter gilvus]
MPRQQPDPRVLRSRAAVLDAAAARFVAQGYAATSMEDVAAGAGVAKRTVFNVFGDKETLFRQVVARSIEVAEALAAALDEELSSYDDVAELPALARRMARAVLTGPAVPTRRMLIAEADRFPELVAEYRRRAPERMLGAIARLLARLAATGTLIVSDADVAAEHFAYLVMGADLDRGMFGAPPPSVRRVEQRATAGAEAFLRAYRPQAG